MCRDSTDIASAELRAKAPSHVFGDHTDFRFWQIENFGQLITDAHCALGRGVYCQALGLPIRYNAVRLERRVGLHLCAVLGLDDRGGSRKTFFNVAFLPRAAATAVGTPHGASLRSI